jgi:hypothetical protein
MSLHNDWNSLAPAERMAVRLGILFITVLALVLITEIIVHAN